MNIRSSVASGCSRLGVDAGLLVGLTQRGGHRTVVPGIGRAAGERRLAGVVPQRRGAHGDQQVGVVGQRRPPATSAGPENSTSTAASRFSRVIAAAALAAVTIASTSAGTRLAVRAGHVGRRCRPAA